MDYHKKQWPGSYDKDVIVKRVTGLPPTSSITTMSTDSMDVVTKCIYMYTICNVVPRKEGRDKINIEDYFLIDQLITREQISLPTIFVKHIEHAKSVSSHGIPFVPLIKMILEYEDCYSEGTVEEQETVGKFLDMKCLSQANFLYENDIWTKVAKPSAPQSFEDLPLLPTAELQGINFMTISEISKQITDQFETLTKAVMKKFDEQSERIEKLEEGMEVLKGR
jgi:hypothetical protein